MVDRYFYEDTPLSKKEQWVQYKKYIEDSNIAKSSEIIEELQYNALSAWALNNVSQKIVSLENSGTDWDKNVIQMSNTPPQNIQVGECYLKITKAV